MTNSLATRMLAMSDYEIGVTACGSYGPDRRDQFLADLRELATMVRREEAKKRLNVVGGHIGPDMDGEPINPPSGGSSGKKG